jgi:hypothetical protein
LLLVFLITQSSCFSPARITSSFSPSLDPTILHNAHQTRSICLHPASAAAVPTQDQLERRKP